MLQSRSCNSTQRQSAAWSKQGGQVYLISIQSILLLDQLFRTSRQISLLGAELMLRLALSPGAPTAFCPMYLPLRLLHTALWRLGHAWQLMQITLGLLQAALLLLYAALGLLETSWGLLGAALSIRQGIVWESCHLSFRNPKVISFNPLHCSCLLQRLLLRQLLLLLLLQWTLLLLTVHALLR